MYDNTSLQISKFLTSVDNLSKSGTITEERFRVYITDELIELIGDLTNPSQDIAIDINKSVPGEILVDGFPRFKGSFFILEAFVDPVSNLKEMELLFQGGETNVKAELTAISMAELFEGETIDYTFLEIKEYLDNPLPYVLNNGYFFPLIDIGQRWSGITPLATGRTDFTRLGQADFSVCVTIKKCLELMPIQITIDIDLDSETLTIAGGTGIDTTGSGTTITIGVSSAVVTLTGTQTLTNKTLTSPTLNSPTITNVTATNLSLTDSSIVFEGASADDFETTLTVVDPTADRTITIPNETGTLITSASAATNAFSIALATALG